MRTKETGNKTQVNKRRVNEKQKHVYASYQMLNQEPEQSLLHLTIIKM